jgi:hypothetical protein
MKATWPSHAGAVDAAALTQFEQLKELVRGVRNARTEYGLEQARKVMRKDVVLLGGCVVHLRVLGASLQVMCQCLCGISTAHTACVRYRWEQACKVMQRIRRVFHHSTCTLDWVLVMAISDCPVHSIARASIMQRQMAIEVVLLLLLLYCSPVTGHSMPVCHRCQVAAVLVMSDPVMLEGATFTRHQPCCSLLCQ